MNDNIHSAYTLGIDLSELVEVASVMKDHTRPGFFIIAIYNPMTCKLTWSSITDVELRVPAFRIFDPQPGTVYFASDHPMTCEAIADKLLELLTARED